MDPMANRCLFWWRIKMDRPKLSVVLSTLNEEKNIARCLASVQGLADEIVVVDEHSTDRTRGIAKKYGAKVFLEPHHEIFHITKQKAIEHAGGDWILQLDADEEVSPELAEEIKTMVKNPVKRKLPRLFARHQGEVEKRDGAIGQKTGEIVAFFIPRRNIFVGKPLIHAGVYPDAVVRLFKKGRAYLPGKSVHEQMVVKGGVSWLFNSLLHHDSPTIAWYISRLNRYTDLHAQELRDEKVPTNLLYLFSYSTIKPLFIFLKLYLRHKGFLDGTRGFLWSAFSAMHYPIAYFKYYTGNRN